MRLDSTILGSVFREKVVANENTSHLLLWHFIVLSDV